MTAREARNRRRAAERREAKLVRKTIAATGATAARLDEAAVYQRAEDSSNDPAERREAKLARKAEATVTTETPTRADINRANSRLSTGPRTPEGKTRSSRNSFKHGLYSKQLLIEGEDPAEFDQLRATLRAEHRPAKTTEEILVDELAQHFWRMRRFRALEARAWSLENLDTWLENGLLSLIQRSMASAERAFHKSLATLTSSKRSVASFPQNRIRLRSLSQPKTLTWTSFPTTDPADIELWVICPKNMTPCSKKWWTKTAAAAKPPKTPSPARCFKNLLASAELSARQILEI